MQQLISIETVPMSIEYVEKKPIKLSSNRVAKLSIEKSLDNSISIKSDNVNIRMDSYNHGNNVTSRPLTYTTTAKYTGGNLNLNVHMNEDGESLFNFKQITADIGSMADAIAPTQYTVRSDGGGGISMNFDLSRLSADMLLSEDFGASFTPPDLELKVVERSKVIIKYIGGPIYIPKSADPNYEPLPEIFTVGTGKNIDMKV
ncbi:MAG: hypothetical protein PHW03_07175 [Eubacteriales bacterium]|nr:hypothetical protein [Eubacteriales bacterium]